MSDFVNNVQQLAVGITRRYTLAVVIIALLSTGAFYALKSVLNDSESTAYIVNISGKQRMLSQHIALDVHRAYQSLKQQRGSEYSQALLSLENRATEMVKANKKLSSGVLSPEFSVSLSDEIREMYFGDMDLSIRVNHYSKLALSIIGKPDIERTRQVLEQIDQMSELLLVDLNKAVQQYQTEGEARLAFVEKLETAVWLITLLALTLEVLFIFRPMAVQVIESAQSEQKLLSSLQEQVELRTLKLEKANKKLHELATHDPLTGLKNRLTLESDVEQLIKLYQRHHQNFGLAMLDIDWFKKVNDTYGHDYGDYVLKEFAELLKSHVRDSDRVYRIGGEEFVIVFNRAPLQDLMHKLEELREQVATYPFKNEEKITPISASFGLFHSSLFNEFNVKNVFKQADSALYESKLNGRNRVTVAGQNCDEV